MTEHVALFYGKLVRRSSRKLCKVREGNDLKEERLTAKILTTPMMETTMPEAMTRRQNVPPRDFSEVAALFRLPRIETPRMMSRMPRVTKPELGERSGQLLAMYRLKRPTSVIMRPTVFISGWAIRGREKESLTTHESCNYMGYSVEEEEL